MTNNSPSNQSTKERDVSLLRRGLTLAGCLGGLGLIGFGINQCQQQTNTLSDEERFLWSIQLPSIANQNDFYTQNFRGKPLLLNFWASWCAPCVQEIPLLSQFAHNNPNWQVAGIALDSQQNAAKFLDRFGVTFPNGLAGHNGISLTRQLGNKSGLPFTIITNHAGHIQIRHAGQIHQTDLQSWRKIINLDDS